MSNKTCRKPVRVVKDVLRQIGKFLFHVDFVILDVKADPKIPLILGTFHEDCVECSWICTKDK